MSAGTVTILGAGAMGSALATPFRAADWSVRLWGTWLDGDLLAACRSGDPHPRTGVRLATDTALFGAGDLDAALEDAELVVLAIASEGVAEVTRRAAHGIASARALLLTSKGFARDASGRVQLLTDTVRGALAAEGVNAPTVMAAGGPCKANEVASGQPTAAVFAARDVEAVAEAAKKVASATYQVEPLDDENGVEICAAMKNVYAIALGVADGLPDRGGQPWHNLKAAIYAQAVRELLLLTRLAGGRPETATGLAGVGDLEVTGISGRNRAYGVRIGRGERAGEALAAMRDAEQTVEGVAAAGLAAQFVSQQGPRSWPELPLLSAVGRICENDPEPVELLIQAALPRS